MVVLSYYKFYIIIGFHMYVLLVFEIEIRPFYSSFIAATAKLVGANKIFNIQ